MILTKADLKCCLKKEHDLYLPKRHAFKRIIASENSYKIFKYLKLLRTTEYHYNNKKNPLHKILYVFYQRRKNLLGRKLGIEMWENTFDSGLFIAHCGNIVVNGHSKIGKNCYLHGSNCIGNDGISSDSPVLGDNIRLGVGAKIIGGVELASNITIAAGAVVVRSCLVEGAVLAGVPAKIIKVNDSKAQ